MPHTPDELQRARQLFPTASDAAIERFLAARRFAASCTPHYAKLIPLTVNQSADVPSFAPRTLREAGFTL